MPQGSCSMQRRSDFKMYPQRVRNPNLSEDPYDACQGRQARSPGSGCNGIL